MTVYVIIHTTVDDTETHHREIVPKIMRAVERHGGKRIALDCRREWGPGFIAYAITTGTEDPTAIDGDCENRPCSVLVGLNRNPVSTLPSIPA